MKAFFTVYEIDSSSKKRKRTLQNFEKIDLMKLFDEIPLLPENEASPDIKYLALGRILKYEQKSYRITNFILAPYTPSKQRESILQVILSVEKI